MRNIFLFTAISLILVSCGSMNHNKIKYSKTSPNKTTVSTEFTKENKTNSKEDESINLSLAQVSDKEDLVISSEKNFISNHRSQEYAVTPVECDKILLRSGDEVLAKVLEIGTEEIKYKKCDNLEGPTVSILKRDVFMITYANGTKDVFKEEANQPSNTKSNSPSKVNPSTSETQVNGFAIASFILGLLGFVPLVGAILGTIGLDQIKRNPDKYRGKGLASVGIILSILWIILIILFVL